MKPWTPVQLAEFDKLTKAASAPGVQLGYARNLARIQLNAFEKEHGTELCQAMFDYLKERDKKRGRR
jgi:hypothetical protein